MSRELLKQALGALEAEGHPGKQLLDALRAALAAPEAEPVAEVRAKTDAYGGTFVQWYSLPVAGTKLYTTPQPAPAVPAVRTFSSDPECNYIAPMDRVCNKCGRIHRDSPEYIAPAAPAVPDAENAALREPDCRTCSHYDDTGPGADICYADICTNGDRYDPLPVVQLWKKP